MFTHGAAADGRWRNEFEPRRLSGRSTTINAAHMSDSYIIEVSSQAAGIVVRDRSGFRFFAASERLQGLEGQVFRTARAAERAASRFVEQTAPQAA